MISVIFFVFIFEHFEVVKKNKNTIKKGFLCNFKLRNTMNYINTLLKSLSKCSYKIIKRIDYNDSLEKEAKLMFGLAQGYYLF